MPEDDSYVYESYDPEDNDSDLKQNVEKILV